MVQEGAAKMGVFATIDGGGRGHRGTKQVWTHRELPTVESVAALIRSVTWLAVIGVPSFAESQSAETLLSDRASTGR